MKSNTDVYDGNKLFIRKMRAVIKIYICVDSTTIHVHNPDRYRTRVIVLWIVIVIEIISIQYLLHKR